MRKSSALATILAIAALLIVYALPALAGAVGVAAGFEDDDGNLAPNSSGINFDWNSFATTTWTGTPPQQVSSKLVSGWQFNGLQDWQASTSDSAFSGGTKQDAECAGVITQKADNKADLKRVYLASKTVGGHVYLMLAWVRIPQNTTSPSAHIAFEFNQNGAGTGCPAGSNGLVHRSTANGGDVLVLYDFEGGGDDPVIRLSRWVGSGACEIGSHSPPCWSPNVTLAAGTAEAKVNTTDTVSDTISPTSPTSETLGIKEFGEAGIDLTTAGVFTPGQCITLGKAFGVSRTSGNSGTAQMKDLVGPGNINLTNCSTVDVTKLGSDGGSQEGAVFTLYAGTGTGGTVVGTCTVDASGHCGPGTVSFSNLEPGTYTIDETVVPTGYGKDPTLPSTFSVPPNQTLTFTDPLITNETDVDTAISLDDHATLTGLNANAPGPSSGGTLTFELFGPYGPSDTIDCDSADRVYTTTVSPITTNGTYGTEDGDNDDTFYVVDNDGASEGIYEWVVTYSGDGVNLPSASDCGDEEVTVNYPDVVPT